MSNVKLSQISSGGAFVVATDTAVVVRNGTTDVLTTLAASATIDTTNASNITSGTLATALLPVNQTYREITFSLDGQGSAIAGSGTWYLACTPFAGTITAWNIVADVSGSISIDVWKSNAAIPTVANTITDANYPALSSAQSAFAGSITGWTTTVAVNDVWAFNVRSASTVTKISLTIQVTAS